MHDFCTCTVCSRSSHSVVDRLKGIQQQLAVKHVAHTTGSRKILFYDSLVHTLVCVCACATYRMYGVRIVHVVHCSLPMNSTCS